MAYNDITAMAGVITDQMILPAAQPLVVGNE